MNLLANHIKQISLHEQINQMEEAFGNNPYLSQLGEDLILSMFNIFLALHLYRSKRQLKTLEM